jgi:hypothetical protein
MPPSETTYHSEINQPAHRPGMESVVNRGGDARDQSGNREGPRRTVGAGTQSAFGPASASDPAPKAAPAAPESSSGPAEPDDMVMKIVDKMQTG